MIRTSLMPCLLFAAASSQAVVAFNTFGLGDSTKSFGYGVGDIRDTRTASQFTPTVTGTLDSLVIKLQRTTAAADATISLFQDSGNDIGSLITSFTTLVSSGGITTFTSSDPSIKLIAGNKYWIEAKTTTAGSGLYTGWSYNNQGVSGLVKFGAVLGSIGNPTSTYRVGTSDLPAFRVNVTPVPEPTTALALGSFAALAAIRRRKFR